MTVWASVLNRGVAERSNAAVLKTVEPQGSGGSNPSSSAEYQNLEFVMDSRFFVFTPAQRVIFLSISEGGDAGKRRRNDDDDALFTCVLQSQESVTN